VIAHLSEPIPKQHLSDAASLAEFVESELRLGLVLELERQLVSGVTANGELGGLANTPGTQAVAFATDRLTTLRKAITAIEQTDSAVSHIVIHPTDWEAIELTREDGATGGYLLDSGPVDRAQARIWASPALSIGH
jgi:HK97 family phage major capsid protein